MKNALNQILSVVVLTAWTSLAVAQEVGVKVDNINATQDTTITIKKGSSESTTTPGKKKWIVTEGEEEIVGDKDVLLKNAEKKWKTACTEWKKEFKEMNKDNKIMNMSCGKMVCTKEGVESTCTSMAKHKMRVIEEE